MTTAVVISRPSTMTNKMPLGRWKDHGRSMLMESLRPTVLPARGLHEVAYTVSSNSHERMHGIEHTCISVVAAHNPKI